MSPRPVDLPDHEFATQIQMARSGRRAEAVKHIERSLRTATDRESIATPAATGLAEIARLAEDAGDLVMAVRALDTALEARPRFADLHFHRACLLLASPRRAEAREALEVALRVNPRYIAARVELALLDARDGMVGDALQALAKLKDETQVADQGAFQQGLRSLERANWDEADSLLKRALDLSDPALTLKLAGIRETLEQGDAESAAQSLRQVIDRHPGYPDLHDLLGLAELRLGHHDDATDSFARALELQPNFHTARVHLAQALEALGSMHEAKAQLAQVLEAESGHAQAARLAERWSERRAAGGEGAEQRFSERTDEAT